MLASSSAGILPDRDRKAIVRCAPLRVGRLGRRHATDRAADLLQHRQRHDGRSGRVRGQQGVDGRVSDFPQELRLPVVAAAPRKGAVSRRLDLKVGNRGDRVFERGAVGSQRSDHPLAFVERAAVADGDAQQPLTRRRRQERRIGAQLVRRVAAKTRSRTAAPPAPARSRRPRSRPAPSDRLDEAGIRMPWRYRSCRRRRGGPRTDRRSRSRLL